MSNSYLDLQWTKLNASVGENIWLITFFAAVVCPTLVVLVQGGFYLFLDITGKPSFLVKYKVHPGKKNHLSMAKLGPLLAQVAFNMIILGSTAVVQLHPLMVWRGCSFDAPLPSLISIIIHIVIFSLCEEVGFYYTHRLLHQPSLYKRFHKKHHEWTMPIALDAAYCHPLEHIISNQIPLAIGPLLMGSHVVTIAIWASLGIFFTGQLHCGYHFPLMNSPQFHDFHHLKFTCNFGILGILDRLHGTDTAFRRTVANKRHRTLLSLSPIHKLFPESTSFKSDRSKQ